MPDKHLGPGWEVDSQDDDLGVDRSRKVDRAAPDPAVAHVARPERQRTGDRFQRRAHQPGIECAGRIDELGRDLVVCPRVGVTSELPPGCPTFDRATVASDADVNGGEHPLLELDHRCPVDGRDRTVVATCDAVRTDLGAQRHRDGVVGF